MNGVNDTCHSIPSSLMVVVGYKPSAATKLSNYPFIRLDRPQYVPVPNIFQPAFGVSALVMLNMEKSSGVSYGVSVRTDPGTLINPLLVWGISSGR